MAHRYIGAAIILAAPWLTAAGGHASPTISVERDGDRLDVVVTGPASLDSVLKRLGEALGVTVEGGGCTKTIGPISLYRATFDDAVRSLAPDHSLIVEREDGTAEIRRILLVEAAPDGNASANEIAIDNPPSPAAEDAGGTEAADVQAAAMRRIAMPARDMARNKQAASLRDIVKLSYAKGKSSAKQLEKLARTPGDTSVRAAALSTLSKSSGVGAVPYLKSRLLGDPDPNMRLAAAQALSHIDPKQSKILIGQAIAMERDPETRKQLRALTAN